MKSSSLLKLTRLTSLNYWSSFPPRSWRDPVEALAGSCQNATGMDQKRYVVDRLQWPLKHSNAIDRPAQFEWLGDKESNGLSLWWEMQRKQVYEEESAEIELCGGFMTDKATIILLPESRVVSAWLRDDSRELVRDNLRDKKSWFCEHWEITIN